MCIAVIVLNYSRRFPLVIAHNREEDIHRPTSPLALRDDILSPIDVEAGGVAAAGMSITTGRIGILTNCRSKSSLRNTGSSRGSILRHAIRTGPTQELEDRIKNDSFKGDFHLYLVEGFVDDTVEVNYLSPVAEPERIERQLGKSRLEVIVRMNEHPASLHDWEPKLQWMKGRIYETLSRNPDLDSLDELSSLIESCLSQSGETDLPKNQSDFSWSPNPNIEPTVLRRVIIAPIDTGRSFFGTVSQTIIIVDWTRHEVEYKYRTLQHYTTGGPQFNPWNVCTQSYTI